MKRTIAEEYSAEKLIEHPAYYFDYLEDEKIAIFLDDYDELFFLNMPDRETLSFGDIEDTTCLYTVEEVPNDILKQAKALLQAIGF